MLELYKNIKKYRLMLGITQQELAIKAGYKDKSMIAKIEKGLVDLPQSKIVQFASIFDVSASKLMGWEKEIDATISKELQISQEALYTINKFALTIDKNTGHSIMDIFNALVVNENFTRILHSILLYIARDEADWEKMVAHFSNDFKKADKTTMQNLCYANIINEFDELLSELLSSDIITFNKVEKYDDGTLHIGIRPENEYLYNLNAAHARTDITPAAGVDTSDDDIMDDPDF